MVESMKNVAKLDFELTVEERNPHLAQEKLLTSTTKCSIYLAEFKTDEERKEASHQSLKGYEAVSASANTELPSTHLIHLGLDLNFSVFNYEIINSPEKVIHRRKYTQQVNSSEDCFSIELSAGMLLSELADISGY
nr:14-3-3-like protein GF14 iota [Tanacetum cinerariifolium]